MLHSILFTAFITAMAALAHGQGPPPLLISPLLLNTKGGFIELRDGEYVRASSIASIEGCIIIEYDIDGKRAGLHRFPLSSESLKMIPTIEKVAATSTGKITNIVSRIEILVNGRSYVIATTGEKSPFDDFDRFGESVASGRQHLEKLLQNINHGEQGGAGQPANRPESESEGIEKPKPDSKPHPR